MTYGCGSSTGARVTSIAGGVTSAGSAVISTIGGGITSRALSTPSIQTSSDTTKPLQQVFKKRPDVPFYNLNIETVIKK